MHRGMVGRNDEMFHLERLSFHIKVNDSDLLVERQCLELVG
jgi:hypothetical protein